MEKIKKAEWAIAVTLTGVIILLLVVRAASAGALWRDECASLQLAQMPTWSEIMKNFQFDSFPLLFPASLRLYTGVFGPGDAALRGFGLLVGLAFVAVAWFNSLLLFRRPPLVSLALIGLNSTFLLWGTSIRGYGVGSVCVLLAFGLMEKLRRTPTLPWALAALGAALVSAHFLFYNAVLLAAIGGAIVFVSIRQRAWKPVLFVAAIGFVCIVSMFLYVGFYTDVSVWNMLLKHEIGFDNLWSEFVSALGGDSAILTSIWMALLVALVVQTFSRREPSAQVQPNDGFYVGLWAAILALIAYYAFLKNLSYVPRPWYFLALVTILAGSLEMMSESVRAAKWLLWVRLILVTAASAILPFLLWPQITKRQTNMDMVAGALEAQAGRNDLLLVSPWYFGVAFHWYYHGLTPWSTMPELSDCRTHRYDLIKEKMMEPHPIDHTSRLVEKTLRAGNRVWLVGGIRLPGPGQVPVILPPAPQSRYGWDEPSYNDSWLTQLGAFLQQHAVRAEGVRVATSAPVNGMENLPVVIVEGWRDQE